MGAEGERRQFGVTALAYRVVDECFTQRDVPIAALKTDRDIAVNLVGFVLEIAVIQQLGAGKHMERFDLEVILALCLESVQLLGVLCIESAVYTPVVVEIVLVVHGVADTRAGNDVLARGHRGRRLVPVLPVKGVLATIVLG